MKNMFKKLIVSLLSLALLNPLSVSAAENIPAKNKETNEENNETVTNAAYTYMEFGSYPQIEIVSVAGSSGVYGKNWENEDAYIIDAGLYNTLNSLSEDRWSATGDTTIDGCKYRRIKVSDATGSKAGEDAYYNWSSSDTYHYFRYEPIKWRVLEQNGNEVLLLSETVLDCQMYNTNITGDLTWESSTVRSWLNGYDSSKNSYGTDYSENNFIDTAFTSGEQSKIIITDLENADNIKSGTEGGNNTSDLVFLLSESEVYGENAGAYGFSTDYDTDDSARAAQSSTYAKAMGAESDNSGNCFWWLRSPGSYPGLFILIREGGSVFRGGQHANSKSRGVRPALRLSLETDNETEQRNKCSDGEHNIVNGVCTKCGYEMPHTPGDINGDGSVDIFDIIRLKKYISGDNVELMLPAADTNGDGKRDIFDLVRLMKYIAGVAEVTLN